MKIKTHAKTAYGLLSHVRRMILEEPRRYNQGTWLIRITDYTERYSSDVLQWPACGTIGCVAGWVAILVSGHGQPSGVGVASIDVEEIAMIALGIDDDQASELFSGGAASGGAPQTLAHARAGAAHIARFQKRYAKQLRAKRV